MMFLPVVFVHPVRVVRLRVLTMAALVLWVAAAASALWQGMAPGWIEKTVLAVVAAYFCGLGFLRDNPAEEA
jgi:phosphatidylcholine synthase